jgi:hypothetical protein
MKQNTVKGKSNTGRLPNVSIDVVSLLDNLTLKNYSPLRWKKEEILWEIWPFYIDFIKRVKKFLWESWNKEDAKRIGEEFILNYESIRLYCKNNKIWKSTDWGKFANIWDDEFISIYFWSDTKIAEELNISEKEVRENFTKSVKLHFAIGNISDPMGALRRVKKHLDETLADNQIAEELKISEEEVRENFTKSVKLYFAINNISDPMAWCCNWKAWEVTTLYWTYW